MIYDAIIVSFTIGFVLGQWLAWRSIARMLEKP